MQFVEHLFGIAPDGGSGLLESCLLSIVLTIVAICAARSHSNGRRGKPIHRA